MIMEIMIWGVCCSLFFVVAGIIWVVFTSKKDLGMGHFVLGLVTLALIAVAPLVFLTISISPFTQTDQFRVSDKAVIGDGLYLIGEGDRWYQISDPVLFYKIQPGQDVQVDALYDRECERRWSCNENPPVITRVYWYGGAV
jgi:hypothetical protein